MTILKKINQVLSYKITKTVFFYFHLCFFFWNEILFHFRVEIEESMTVSRITNINLEETALFT